MRTKVIIAGAIGALAVLAVAGMLVVPHFSRASASPAVRDVSAPRSAPPGAVSAVRVLVSAKGRDVLAPELNAVLGPGRLFPAGSTFIVQPDSWHQAGAYANVSGILRVPGKAPEHAEIGLMDSHGRWLVTFEGQL
jgi:hypothetical protein